MNCIEHNLEKICENCRRSALPINVGKRFPCVLSAYRVRLYPILKGNDVKWGLIDFMRKYRNSKNELHTYWTLTIIKEVSPEYAEWYEKLLVLI